MPAPPLVMQTTYAELLERSSSAAFSDAFPANGGFTPKTINGRRYWYFQTSTGEGRTQRYVGPETPELLERIAHHKEAREDERERRALVSTLVRSFGLPRPIADIGEIVAALAKAGVFRLRGVLVGTAAYQTYSAMLGTKLPAAILQTSDVDIAQFTSISGAIKDQARPVLDVLREVDKTFREVPYMTDTHRVATYAAKGGLRVDFLPPNEGPDTDTPQRLPAFQTDAQPLRFLDFLIHDPEPAVLLHGAGIYVLVPSPARYAVHKLIISQRRRVGAGKREKDTQQAEALLEILTKKRSRELELVWNEAYQRGDNWRQLLLEGVGQLASLARDDTLKAVGLRRSILPSLDLVFDDPTPHYDFSADNVTFLGKASGEAVKCAITRAALDDHLGTDGFTKEERVERCREKRSAIEYMARNKYLNWPIEEPGSVLIRTNEVSELMQETPAMAEKTK